MWYSKYISEVLYMHNKDNKKVNGVIKSAIAAIGVTGASVMTACTLFSPAMNEEPAVYGPPEMFDPSINEENEIYGPPEMFDPDYVEDEDPDVEDEITSEEPEVYDPMVNEEPCVYGPPEMMEKQDDFRIKDNIPEVIYGPPEMMENSGNKISE